MPARLLALLLLLLPALATAKEAYQLLPPDDPRIQYSGRIDFSDPKAPRFDWPGVKIIVRFTGGSVGFRLQDGGNDYNLAIDGKPAKVWVTQKQTSDYAVSGLSKGVHTAVLSKRTEGSFGLATFQGVLLAKGSKALDPPARLQRRIEFLGASWFCGYGNEGASLKCGDLRPVENNDLAFGSVAAKLLGAEYHTIAYSGRGIVRNYGDKAQSDLPYGAYFGRTLVNDPQSPWDFKRWVPDVVVLNLGVNDYSTAPQPDPALFAKRYLELLARVRAAYPQAWIVSYDALGWPDYAQHVRAAMAQFKERGDQRSLCLDFPAELAKATACDYHPNVQEDQKLGEDLAAKLAPLWERPGAFRYDFKGPLDEKIWERAQYSLDEVGSLIRPADAQDGPLGLSLFVKPLPTPVGQHRFTGAGLQTRAFFSHGRFTVRMRSDIKPGTVSSFFLMNKWEPGNWFHKEIDIEFLGREPHTVQFVNHRYHSDQGAAGMGKAYVHRLPFGYADGFHDYSIHWTADKVEWSVDGTKVWETDKDVPDEPLNIFINHWGPGPDEAWSAAWVGKMDIGALPSKTEYQWITFEPDK